MAARAAGLALMVAAGLTGALAACESTPDRGAPSPGVPRVASGVVLADETLWAMGPEARARTVAVSALVDDPLYSAVAGQWNATLPRLSPNPEQLVALRPTTVILAGFSHADYRAAAAERVDVVMLESFDTFDAYRHNVEQIGAAVGLPERARALVDRFEARRAALIRTRAPESAWPTCMSWIAGYVAAAGTTFDDVSRHAGCRNLAAAEGLTGHAPLETEQLLAWDPAVLVVQCPPSGCAHAVDELRRAPGMASLSAVRSGRVVAIEGRALLSTGAGMLDAVEALREGLERTAPP